MIVSAVCLLAMIQSEKPIQLTLPLGTRVASTLEMKFVDKSDDFEMTTKDKYVSTVTKVDRNIIQFEHKVTPVSLTMDGFERPIDNPEAATFTETRNRSGAQTEFESGVIDPLGYRMIARLLSVPLPREKANIGSTWTFQDNRDPMPYRFSGLVKLQTENILEIEVKLSYDQGNPFKSVGLAVVDLKTGWPKRVNATAKGCLIPGGEDNRVDLTLTWETQEVKMPSK